ncbi:MAG: ribonuclease HII, partial [Eudoraea sp.]|nr:ribonuclease HII [Eudoraea sp.]
VQDMSNRLHLLSSNGKVLWSKQLQNPKLGEVQEVDILRNGKKQLVFATKNKLHLIDRNGNDVAPFPIKFKDEVTQPLSVFDYDNNRKYRFAIVQNKDVLLYDNKGKLVAGFKFKGTDSRIVLPVQHMRMGNKDYILIAEDKGTLHILSRVGKSRVSVGKRFRFSNIPIAEEGTSFVVITSEKTKESISQSGKVSSQKLNVSDSYSFKIKFRTKVTLDDNLLRINGKLVELPFGIYTEPALFRAKRTTYITITETQENKVYIYNTSGELISGFPVYGSSIAELSADNRTKNIRLLVAGEANEIILYEVQ